MNILDKYTKARMIETQKEASKKKPAKKETTEVKKEEPKKSKLAE